MMDADARINALISFTVFDQTEAGGLEAFRRSRRDCVALRDLPVPLMFSMIAEM